MTEITKKGGSKPLDREKIVSLMRDGYTVNQIHKEFGWNYGSIRTHVILHQIETGEDFGVTHKDGVTRQKSLKMRRQIKELMDFNDPPLKVYKIAELVGATRTFVGITIKAWRLGELDDDGSMDRTYDEYRKMKIEDVL